MHLGPTSESPKTVLHVTITCHKIMINVVLNAQERSHETRKQL